MDTSDYVLKKYGLNREDASPLIIKKSRWSEMPVLFKELDFKVGAEVGVLKGEFTEVLCKAGFKMYGIDAWQFYHTYKDFRKQSQLDEFYEEAKKRTNGYDCTLMKAWSADAVKEFKDGELDFVFIDGNHALEYVIEDIAKWSPKVRKGGIIAGHDYFRPRHTVNLMHVKDAVNTWCYCYNVKPFFVFSGDKCPSWFFIKN